LFNWLRAFVNAVSRLFVIFAGISNLSKEAFKTPSYFLISDISIFASNYNSNFFLFNFLTSK
jgi:hypothetical protein